MNLRFIERDGKIILQQEFWCNITEPRPEWQDVPVHKEPEQQKPRTIADNIRDGAYSDWSRQEPKQQKPREFWIAPFDVHESFQILRAETSKNSESDIHVTEVPKGYKLISRDELQKAYERFSGFDPADGRSIMLKMFLENLGFDE